MERRQLNASHVDVKTAENTVSILGSSNEGVLHQLRSYEDETSKDVLESQQFWITIIIIIIICYWYTSLYVDNLFQENRHKSKIDLSRIYLSQKSITSSVFYL